ncbi:MAG: site-specific DNA-methyltransferase [Phycisphaerales bacterium]|nr:site-specific DNA-methyltransferase [Phycisphaerales bacterium]
MARAETQRVERQTPDLLAEQLAALRELMPQIFTEGRVDGDKLRETLGDFLDERPERYSFTWAGKRDAIRLLQIPSRATLTPVPAESVNFDTTQNLFIEGENLEVLKLLYKAYAGRVKMIYIDPPYNTGNDFIYPDNFADPLGRYLELTGQKDAQGNLLTSNPETSGRYHSAWLSMMYPRLFVARQLLREDGVIFISIDDNEVHNLRCLLNEIFGEENFIATIIWQKVFAPKNTAKYFSEDHDYIVVVAKSAVTWLPTLLPRTAEADARYHNPDNDPRGTWSSSDLTARNYYSEGLYEVTGPSGKPFKPAIGAYWRVRKDKFIDLDRDGRIWWGKDGGNMPRLKRFLSEVREGIVPQTLWKHDEVGNTQEAKKELLENVRFENTDNVLDTVKPTRMLQRLLQVATESDNRHLLLDFFAGSAPMGHAVMKQNRQDGGNRKYICVQIPESLPSPENSLKTIADIGKERIRRVIKKLEQENEGKLDLKERAMPEDLGFKVFKLAESHFRSWAGAEEKDGESLLAEMEKMQDPLLPGWRPHDVIYEVALREGYSLTSAIEELKDIADNRVYRVTDPDREQTFRICLDDTLKDKTIKALNLTRDDLFICRDVALTDEQAANLALQCRLKTI